MLSKKMQTEQNGVKMVLGTRRQIIYQQQQLKRLASSSGEAAERPEVRGCGPLEAGGGGPGSGLPGLGFARSGTERQKVTEK